MSDLFGSQAATTPATDPFNQSAAATDPFASTAAATDSLFASTVTTPAEIKAASAAKAPTPGVSEWGKVPPTFAAPAPTFAAAPVAKVAPVAPAPAPTAPVAPRMGLNVARATDTGISYGKNLKGEKFSLADFNEQYLLGQVHEEVTTQSQNYGEQQVLRITVVPIDTASPTEFYNRVFFGQAALFRQFKATIRQGDGSPYIIFCPKMSTNGKGQKLWTLISDDDAVAARLEKAKKLIEYGVEQGHFDGQPAHLL